MHVHVTQIRQMTLKRLDLGQIQSGTLCFAAHFLHNHLSLIILTLVILIQHCLDFIFNGAYRLIDALFPFEER